MVISDEYIKRGGDMNVQKETRNLVLSALFLAIAVIIQLLGKSIPQISQFLVGPVVNAVIILTTYFAGHKYGILVGALTPLLAYATNVLAPAMFPFVPFIALGNIIYVITFSVFRSLKNKEVIGVMVGSVLKYLFLFYSATKLIDIIAPGMKEPVKAKLAIAMGTPQLVTALIGGGAAIILYQLLKKRVKGI